MFKYTEIIYLNKFRSLVFWSTLFYNYNLYLKVLWKFLRTIKKLFKLILLLKLHLAGNLNNNKWKFSFSFIHKLFIVVLEQF